MVDSNDQADDNDDNDYPRHNVYNCFFSGLSEKSVAEVLLLRQVFNLTLSLLIQSVFILF